MTTTCTACGADGQTGAFCSVCGTPTVAAGLGPQAMSARLEGTTEPEAREYTRQGPAGAVRGATPVGGATSAGTLPLAGVGRRVGAYVLDLLAVSLVVLVVSTVVAFVVDLPGRMAALADVSTEMGVEAAAGDVAAAARSVWLVAAFVGLLCWVGLAVWEGRTGAAVGSRILGIRTHAAPDGSGPTSLSSEDAPLGVGRSLLRWLMLALSGVVPLVGTVLMLLSPSFDASGRRQGWHDKVARSIVHDVRAASPRSFAPATSARPGPATQAVPMVPAVPAAAAVPATAAAPAASAAAAGTVGDTVMASGVASARASAQATGSTASPAADPWDFPAGGRVDAAGGLITGVPGLAGAPAAPAPVQSPSPVQAPSPAQASAPTGAMAVPAAAAAASAPAPYPSEPYPSEPLEDLEATRFGVSSRRSTGEGVPPTPATTIDLPSGRRVRIDARTLLGRNPQPDGTSAALLRVEDPSRSVSKTHLELVPTSEGLRVTDLGSTNGSAAITPAGEVRELAPGVASTVGTGWTVQVGDLRFTVAGPVDA